MNCYKNVMKFEKINVSNSIKEVFDSGLGYNDKQLKTKNLIREKSKHNFITIKY